MSISNISASQITSETYATVKALTKDPAGVFRFWVEIDGLLVAGFSEVSGLEVKTETEEYREGGVNDRKYTFPTGTTHSNIILKWGATGSIDFWYWHQQIVKGKIIRKNGTILLMNQMGLPLRTWNFFEGYPIRWKGPDLRASSSEIAVEEVEIVHEGIKERPNSQNEKMGFR